jgi:hypothetical protein
MTDLYSQPTDENSAGQDSHRAEGEQVEGGHPQPSLPLSGLTAVPQLPQVAVERLEALLDSNDTDAVCELHNHVLYELGKQIRQWRLAHKYTRRALADLIGADPVLLLCLENGIAQAGHVPKAHAQALSSLIEEVDGDCPLLTMISDYLLAH